MAADKWSRAKGVGWQTFEGATVILDPGRNLVHELNATGTFLWSKLDAVTDEELAAAVAAEFDVPIARASDDTGEFLGRLEGLGLVETT